jgi:hypothetical protein
VGQQLALAARFAATYPELPFGEGRRDGSRYWLANRGFGHGDGVVLYSMLRYLQPRRFMSIGSGPSSGCALDTAARFVPDMVMRFFELRPQRLDRMLRATDRARVIVAAPASYRVDDFIDLQGGDVLFVDASALTGSGCEVAGLLRDLVRRLPNGVVVHVPDLSCLLPGGRRQNGRSRFPEFGSEEFDRLDQEFAGLQVMWSNRWLATVARDRVAAAMPVWNVDPGSSVWLRRHPAPRADLSGARAPAASVGWP